MPTYKDVDFRNNMQKVYVSEEEKERIMDKLNRDVEVSVRDMAQHQLHYSTICISAEWLAERDAPVWVEREER